MDILYLLVPLSVVAMLAILAVFAWALQGGQFDELEGIGAQILDGGEGPPPTGEVPSAATALDGGQGVRSAPPEESSGPVVNSKRSPT